jgi:hypothetical protein
MVQHDPWHVEQVALPTIPVFRASLKEPIENDDLGHRQGQIAHSRGFQSVLPSRGYGVSRGGDGLAGENELVSSG